jgi:hypothetical protein
MRDDGQAVPERLPRFDDALLTEKEGPPPATYNMTRGINGCRFDEALLSEKRACGRSHRSAPTALLLRTDPPGKPHAIGGY